MATPEIAGNCFFVVTDSNGRKSVDFALVPNVDTFRHKLRAYWREAGGKVEFISKSDYSALIKTNVN